MARERVSWARIGLGGLSVGTALLLIATVGCLAARWHWFAELFAHFRAQYAIGGGLLAVLWFLLGRGPPAAVTGLLALYHTALLAPAFVPHERPPALEAQPRFRLISVNLMTENESHAGLVAWLREERPDVVVLLEVGEAWRRDLEPLADVLPAQWFVVRDDNFGIAALARDRRTTFERIACGEGMPSVRVRMPLAETTVTLLGTHPWPPTGGSGTAGRDEQLRGCAALLALEPRPRVLAGDLNITPWTPIFDDLLALADLRDSRDGFGLQPSWLRSFPPLAIPIDHVLHDDSLVVLDRQIGPEFGSDHRPVRVDFAFVEPRR